MDDKSVEPSKEDKWFFVDKNKIVDNGYDLSINKYKEIEYEEVVYEKPEIILNKIEELEKSILEHLVNLRGMIK